MSEGAQIGEARHAAVPDALAPLVRRIVAELAPTDIWLFGSRARADAGPGSDWDLVVALPEERAGLSEDPAIGWRLQRESGVMADLILAAASDIAALWGIPNTIGYDLARDGIRLDVDRAGHR
jgi:predicted nucleotidyltransferase